MNRYRASRKLPPLCSVQVMQDEPGTVRSACLGGHPGLAGHTHTIGCNALGSHSRGLNKMLWQHKIKSDDYGRDMGAERVVPSRGDDI